MHGIKHPGDSSSKDVQTKGQRNKKYDSENRVRDVLHRMMEAVGAKTQTDLAEILKVGKAAISDAKQRGVTPPGWLIKLSRPPYCVNPTWVETGVGAMRIGDGFAEHTPGYGHPIPPEFEYVPMVRARPSGGGGSLETDSDIEGYYAFRKEWLLRKGSPGFLRLMRVTGESMHPTLHDEDIVLVDESQKDILEGKIYVIRIDDDIVVKRVGKKPGTLVLISDNRDLYPPMDLDMVEDTNTAVIGRVIWLARESI